jgi:glycosyltransferase 2 family protein
VPQLADPASRGPRLQRALKHRRTVWLAVRIAVTGALLGALLHGLGGISAIASALASLSAGTVAIALVALTADRLLMTAKWLLLIPARGGRIGLLAGTRIYCSSLLYGLLLPATLGADAIRVALSARRGVRLESVLASVLVERLLGGVALLTLSLVSLAVLRAQHPLSPELDRLARPLALALAAGLAATGIALVRPLPPLDGTTEPRRWHAWPGVRRVRALHTAWHAQIVSGPRLGAFFGLTLIEQMLPLIPIAFLLRDLGHLPPLGYVACAMALAHLAARLPVSIGGIGVQEVSLAYLLTLGGAPHDAAVLTALALRMLEILCCVPWWLSGLGALGPIAPPAPQRAHTSAARSAPPLSTAHGTTSHPVPANPQQPTGSDRRP